MRKIVLLISGLLLTEGACAQSNGVHFGLRAGLSLATLDGTINEGARYQPGLAAGVLMQWRPSPGFALQPAVVFAQQGCRSKYVLAGTPLDNRVRLNYLNVPVLAKVYLGSGLHLDFGPQLGVLLTARRRGQVGYSPMRGYITTNADVRSDYRNDVAFCAGLGADLPNGLILAARYNHGFTDINNNEVDQLARRAGGIGGLYNRALDVSVGYLFGLRNTR
ncbi:PorT family protein [Hymenobacter sp. 15J16-1T3B]|uniref:porin family protein n=1 Tax=Hymenobacter sp. 15J16-1T3B TaxID=2886941 RepID=UPI001D0F9664|nr:porin family protein [Hymenobacter sp. 15J16-1T3B]MCC3155881.1 PorT family protein [Hymenobacter sp. 15J16-1T3B]